ncbi:MAG: peptide chain release factor N(5)-glutamine methyltransferase [Bacillota bacterium]
MQVQEILKKATEELKAAGIESPRLDAEVLLAAVLRCEKLLFYREPGHRISREQAVAFASAVGRRAAHEPTAYITGEKEFMGLTFGVSTAVLIPRPETELMVETARLLLQRIGSPAVADVGTGSGAVAVSLAVLIPGVRIFASDISSEAIAVAEGNAVRHGVAERVSFYRGDLLEPFLEEEAVFDLVAANLPYVPAGELAKLPEEVRFEPESALDGGPDGLDPYRRLIPQAVRLVKPGGFVLMEIGPGQGRAAVELLTPDAWEAVIKPDLAGWERLVVARRVKA